LGLIEGRVAGRANLVIGLVAGARQAAQGKSGERDAQGCMHEASTG
jgi:hypothetical protein